MKKVSLFSAATLAILLLGSCKKEEFTHTYYEPGDFALISNSLNLPAVPHDYSVKVPFHLGGANATLNKDMATLGRVLFYDKKLSKDGTISCASCHHQNLAFSDNVALSKGVFSRTTERNSQALGSVPSFQSFYGTNTFTSNGFGAAFFWDNRVGTAADQSRSSMTNSREMDMTMHEIVEMVAAQDYYAPLFKQAFGSSDVSEQRVTSAIAEFVNSLGSMNSKFDQAITSQNIFNLNTPFSQFTDQENLGKSIYNNSCAGCHSENFGAVPMSAASNGLDLNPTDFGVGGVTGLSQDRGTFKVPTLRNIALTGPYMHDGRFKTIEEVIEFYSTGIQPHANLHPMLRTISGEPKKFNFSTEQKQALVAFLKTLTDEQFIADVRFSDPFKQ
ncbi:MAG: c-type cytochrome [Chitinophagales bacterium]|nr:c-type cytochrome [Chitinophagales bacterium]